MDKLKSGLIGLKSSTSSIKNWFLKLSFFKKIVIILLAIFLVWISLRLTVFGGDKSSRYQTAQVQRGTIIATVSESGNVASNNSAGVGSPTTGIIENVYVSDGQSVTAGENLFKVKSTATSEEIASAWAAYQNSIVAANTALQSKTAEQATLEKDRAAVITASQAVTAMQNNGGLNGINPATKQNYTQNDIDTIISALTSNRETFSADEQKYNQSGENISAASASENSAWLAYEATQDSIVTAPIDGTVSNITVKSGDKISASGGNLSSNSTTNSLTNAVLSIGNFSALYIKVQASEVDIPKIHVGQKAVVTLDAFTGKTFAGTVDLVDTMGTISSGVVTYNVFVTLISPPPGILPGMSATVSIETNRHNGVLFVPSSAVQSISGSSALRVMKNGKITAVPVATGLTSDTDIEITSGVSEGDTVIIGVLSAASAKGSSSAFGAGAFHGGGGLSGGTFLRH